MIKGLKLTKRSKGTEEGKGKNKMYKVKIKKGMFGWLKWRNVYEGRREGEGN